MFHPMVEPLSLNSRVFTVKLVLSENLGNNMATEISEDSGVLESVLFDY